MSELTSRDETQLAPVSPGQLIGERYLVEGPIGEGGMGLVCRAKHVGLETPVAIKLIRPDFKDDEDFVRRFLNEARRAAALKSERITHVHDVGQLDSGEPYLVMELLEGIELEKYLMKHGRLSESDAVNVVLQLCEGLAEAHAAGIVHRDIKPSNAFLVRRADGRFGVKILDFGISKQMLDGSASITNHDQSLGSPQYMSPEQMLDPSSVDHRSDIWSVGVVLFELLAGERPFDGASVPEVCAKVLTSEAPRLSDVRPDVSPELDAIVARCLSKDPSARFEDVAVLGAALQRFAGGRVSVEGRVVETTFFDPKDAVELGSIAPTAGTLPPPRERRSRRAHWLGAIGLALTLVVAGAAFGRASVAFAERSAADVRLPWEPALAAGPAPAELEPPARTYSLLVPLHQAFAEVARDEVPVAEDGTPGATQPSTPAAAGVAPGVATPTHAVAPGGTAAPAYGLSPSEIRRRIERYRQWLDDQGLMRLDSAADQPEYMREP